MNMRLRLAGVVLCAAAGIASAQADNIRPGSYRLTVGSAPSCGLSLSEDGTATIDCDRIGSVAHWKSTGSGFELQDSTGATVATLKEGNDAYTGRTATNRKVLVAR